MPWFKSYRLRARLTGHDNAVYALAISKNGHLLASGGVGGVMLWDLRTNKKIGDLWRNCSVRGPTTSMVWLTRTGETQDLLCEGTVMGWLSVWARSNEGIFCELHAKRHGEGGEIVCMAKDDRTQEPRVAAGTRDMIVQVFTIDANGRSNMVFSVSVGLTMPIALDFMDNTTKDVRVFGLYDGRVHILRGDNGGLLRTTEIGGTFGSVQTARAANRFVVDGVANGVDMYELDTGKWLANFTTRKPPVERPNGVAFADNFNEVVYGSNHGAVYVFDVETGAQKQVLRHKGECVQTVATHDTNEANIIISASSGDSGQRSICVWKRKPTAATPTGAGRSGSEVFVRFVIWVIIVAFVYQNAGMQLRERLPIWKTTTTEVWNIFRNPDAITAEYIRATIREINERMQGAEREAAEEFDMDELERRMEQEWERSKREIREQEMLARERLEEFRREREKRIEEAEKEATEMWERREGEDGGGQGREGQDPQGQTQK